MRRRARASYRALDLSARVPHHHHTPAASASTARTSSLHLPRLVRRSHSVASGRLSYILDLRGPALAFDTACSTALVASHGAASALKLDECTDALVSNVNLMLLPGVSAIFAMAGMTSPTGKCHTFDAMADGYVRGEAIVATTLHSEKAVFGKGAGGALEIVGSRVICDGKSASLTAPNGQAQQALLKATLKASGMVSDDLDLLEAHGTGTALGDPIEMRSMFDSVFASRSASRPQLAVGAAKANVGHSEVAAGAVGLLKLALGLTWREASPIAGLTKINPMIASSMPSSCALPQALTKLPQGPVAGGVSSFGYSGTIAHTVLKAEENVADISKDQVRTLPSQQPSRSAAPLASLALASSAARPERRPSRVEPRRTCLHAPALLAQVCPLVRSSAPPKFARTKFDWTVPKKHTSVATAVAPSAKSVPTAASSHLAAAPITADTPFSQLTYEHQLSRVLSLAHQLVSTSVDVDDPLMDAGMDSISARELFVQLQELVGESPQLDMHAILGDKPDITTRQLTDELHTLVGGDAAAAASAPPPREAVAAAAVAVTAVESAKAGEVQEIREIKEEFFNCEMFKEVTQFMAVQEKMLANGVKNPFFAVHDGSAPPPHHPPPHHPPPRSQHSARNTPFGASARALTSLATA